MRSVGEDVYCTLLMSDSYLPGAAVLAKSLRDNGTKQKLAALVTPDSLLPSTVTALKEIYDYVLPVERIASPNLENLARLDRLDLRFAFTKIALWKQIQFRKIIYLDADVVALRAPDELFNIDSHFAAAPDIGWPDIFNSGVMALTPSMSEYWSLHTLASSGTSFDGADQGLLNEYFGNRPWHRLSFAYNCTPSASYQYEPAYRHFRSSISMVHFIGKTKPWMDGRQALTAGSSGGVYKELLGKWWSTYDRYYRITSASALGQAVSGVRTIQQYVKGEQFQSASDWAATGQLSGDQPPPPTPLTLPSSKASSYIVKQESVEATPAPKRTTYSAPSDDWDATRNAPVPGTRPEAPGLPSARYEMSHDHELFRATNFTQAPKIPAQREIPTPVFPWETTAPKATRVFAEDLPSRTSETASQLNTTSTAPLSEQDSTALSSQRPEQSLGDPWNSFTRTNAWDDNVSIDRYIRNFKLAQKAQRQGQVQVIQQQESQSAEKDFATAPDSPPVARRRESLILTDFPDANDRPSLPVTPAPVHRQTFWGHERDQEGNLPAAQGVPEQAEWDPTERLEELRRSSLVATEDLPNSAPRLQQDIPIRIMPSSSISRSSTSASTTGASASDVHATIAERRQSSREVTKDLPETPLAVQWNTPILNVPFFSDSQTHDPSSTDVRSISASNTEDEELHRSNLATAEDPTASSFRSQQDIPTGNISSSSISRSRIFSSSDVQSIDDSAISAKELRGSDVSKAKEATRDFPRSEQDSTIANLASSTVSIPAPSYASNVQSTGASTARDEERRSSNSAAAGGTARDSSHLQQEAHDRGTPIPSTEIPDPAVSIVGSATGIDEANDQNSANFISGSDRTLRATNMETYSTTGMGEYLGLNLDGIVPSSNRDSSAVGQDERHIGAMATSASGAHNLLSSLAHQRNLPASSTSSGTGLNGVRGNDFTSLSSSVDRNLSSGGLISDMHRSNASLAEEATERRANDIASFNTGTGGPLTSSVSPPSGLGAFGTSRAELSSSILGAGSTNLASNTTEISPLADLKPLEALAQELRTSANVSSSTSGTYTADQSRNMVTAPMADTRALESLVHDRGTAFGLNDSISSAERANQLSNTATSSFADTRPLEALIRGSEARTHMSPLGSTATLITGGHSRYTSDLTNSRSMTADKPLAASEARSYPSDLSSLGSGITSSSLASGATRSYPSELPGAGLGTTSSSLAPGLGEQLAGELASSSLVTAIAGTGEATSTSSRTRQSDISPSYNTPIDSGFAGTHEPHSTYSTGSSGLVSSTAGIANQAHSIEPPTYSYTSTTGGSSLTGGAAHGSLMLESNIGSSLTGSHGAHNTRSTQGTYSARSSGINHYTTGASGSTAHASPRSDTLSSSTDPSSALRFEQSGGVVDLAKDPMFTAAGERQSSSTTTSNITGATQSSSSIETPSTTSSDKREASALGRLRIDKVGPFDEYEIA